MTQEKTDQFTAFRGMTRIATGPLAEIARLVKQAADADNRETILVFSMETGIQTDLDLSGRPEDVIKRYSPAPPKPGRPKLGVIAREVTLLPRHWDWLNRQPGGASVTLRKLVETARGATEESPRKKQDATYKFMTAMAGNLPGYEEATRALFAGDDSRFRNLVKNWPQDISDQALKMAGFFTPG